MSMRALLIPLVVFSQSPAALAATDCASTPSVTAESPLLFGRISVKERGTGAVVVPATGGMATTGEVMSDDRGEPGRLTICGDPSTRLFLFLSTGRLAMGAGTEPRAIVRDFEIRGSGAVIQKLAEDRWLLSMGARGRAELVVGATMIVPRNRQRGTLTQAVSVQVQAAP